MKKFITSLKISYYKHLGYEHYEIIINGELAAIHFYKGVAY